MTDFGVMSVSQAKGID